MKGFTLVEVMVCLFIVCFISFSVFSLGVMCTRFGTEAQDLSFASCTGRACLEDIAAGAFDSVELGAGWHAGSRVKSDGRSYCCFWSVTESVEGKLVELHVAWGIEDAFGSIEELRQSGCSFASMKTFVERPALFAGSP